MDLIKPKALQKGNTIGIFTPSLPMHLSLRAKYLHGIDQLRGAGFSVVEGMLTKSGQTQGYRAGSPKDRAEEFMSLIVDKSVHALMSTIGGNNSSSLIPYLDFDIIRANPKIICGYSDVTSLHMAILKHSKLSTFYGPAVIPSFGEHPNVLEETFESFFQAISPQKSRRKLTPPKHWSNEMRDARSDAWKIGVRKFEMNAGWKCLNAGSVTAPAVVANLNTLVSVAGTSSFPDLEGKILIIEEMLAPMSRLERNLRQLEQIGVFDAITGLVFGKPEVFQQEDAPFGVDELLLEVVGMNRKYPIVSEFDCGHTAPMLTLAEMSKITLNTQNNYKTEIWIEESMVST